MLVEQRFDKRAGRHDLEAFLPGIGNKPLNELRRNAVATQCDRHACMFSHNRADTQFAVG